MMLPPASPTSVVILRKPAGTILDLHDDVDSMRPSRSISRRMTFDSSAHVDIAAGEDDADLLADEKLRIGGDGGIGRGTRAFHHCLFDLEKRRHRALDLILAHEQHVLHQFANDLAA